ncbi:hypothetical protein HYDPIDRAFT_97299, partial [Hydnomerulius pinastri MD-312]
VLHLVKELFVHIPPNTSVWCKALEAFFHSLGYKVDAKEGIWRQFSNAYHWYCVLNLSLDKHIRYLSEACTTPHPNPTPAGSQSPTTVTVPHDRHSLDVEQSVPDNSEQTRDSPSPYLRHRCPLCFGGVRWRNHASIIDAIICIDACFTQKHRSGHIDDPRNPTGTVFLSKPDLDKMEGKVDALRKPRKRGQNSREVTEDVQDGYEQGMNIPTSVLNGCNDSFLAADEKRQKASMQFFSDTGVMVLLCHHDCVIHLANMTSAGEKQHYALMLLKALFDHLPSDFHVGLLYDIGCQLERSSSPLPSPYSMRLVTNGLASSFITLANDQTLSQMGKAVSDFGARSRR